MDIYKSGKNFNWIRPICDCGVKKVWGHGFVQRFIDGLSVYLKRYRCPKCQTVFTLVPSDHVQNCQHSSTTILNALSSRLSFKKWPSDMPRQRAGYWMRQFQRFSHAHFPNEDHALILKRLLELKTCFQL